MKTAIILENGIKHELTKDEIIVLQKSLFDFYSDNEKYHFAKESLLSLLEHLD